MIVNKNSIYVIILSANYVFSAVTTIDFEIANSGYSASDTEGSGWTDIFNRTNYNIVGVTEDGYYWAAEDLSLSDPYLTLSQISISSASSFVVQLDMVVKNDSKWDASDEVLITYSIDGGSHENLISIQSISASSNKPVAFDTDFDGTGECGTATTLSHKTAGTEDGCTSTNDGFASYTSPVVSLSSNSTLDIKIQFNNLTSGDEGIYIDNIIVTTDPEKCTISGNSGFRMMSSPVAGAIYADLLSELWTQGMTGSDVGTSGNANVWVLNGYSGTQSFSELTDITTSGASITAGEGFLLYVFSDTDWDGDDDLPVTISVVGKLNNSSATFPSSGSIAASKYGLAGNPYNATIDFDLITLSSNIEVTTSVWDDANTDWKTWNKTSQSGDLSNGLIAPYQGFWVQTNSSGTGTITIETGDKSGTGTFYKIADDDNRGSISIKATSGNFVSENYLSFYSEGTTELDEGDSKKLLPFQASSRVVIMSVVDGQPLKINSFPYENIVTVTVPIDVMNITLSESNYVTEAGEVTLTWNMDQLPNHISMTLTDNITGSEAYLDNENEYVFTTEPKGSFSATYDGPIGTYPVVGEPRFTLNVTYGALGQNEGATLPSNFALHPVYPNPFNPCATISFDIPDVSRVELNIYDVKGSLVEILLKETMKPGKHHYNWEPQGLPSGVYFMKLTTANQFFTQKVTYIK